MELNMEHSSSIAWLLQISPLRSAFSDLEELLL